MYIEVWEFANLRRVTLKQREVTSYRDVAARVREAEL